MAPLQQQAALFKEGRIALAEQAYKHGQSPSVLATAIAFDIPRTTLRDCLNGIKPRYDSIAPNRLLSPTEEQTLIQWILLIDRHGMPPRLLTIYKIAGILLYQHNQLYIVGENWARNFVRR
jgi:hypothetical protein